MKKLKLCRNALYPNGTSEVVPYGDLHGSHCPNVGEGCEHGEPHVCEWPDIIRDECTCEEIEQLPLLRKGRKEQYDNK